MQFKFIPSLMNVKTNDTLLIDGCTYTVQSVPRPNKSAIVSNGKKCMILIVQVSPSIVGVIA